MTQTGNSLCVPKRVLLLTWWKYTWLLSPYVVMYQLSFSLQISIQLHLINRLYHLPSFLASNQLSDKCLCGVYEFLILIRRKIEVIIILEVYRNKMSYLFHCTIHVELKFYV